MSIIIKSLSKSYGNKKILNEVSLCFKQGEVNGIVGENGAGKTTLFKCIAGLEEYNGDVVYENNILKNTVGFLPTNPNFISKITGEEYLQLLCNARDIKISSLSGKNIFDLPLKQYCETYSTGMKKKLALTGLLIQNNEVFILDEPFNGVDIHSNIIIEEILDKLKELGKIIVISSHIFSALNKTCDNLHYLKGGEIAKSVQKDEFHLIEKEMKGIGIRSKIDKLIF